MKMFKALAIIVIGFILCFIAIDVSAIRQAVSPEKTAVEQYIEEKAKEVISKGE